MKEYEAIEAAMEAGTKRLAEIVSATPEKMIYTDSDDNKLSFIYALKYGENGVIDDEKDCHIKAIRLNEENGLEILLGDADILSTPDDVKTAKDDEWDVLFGGDVMGWFTLTNILGIIEEYIGKGYNKPETATSPEAQVRKVFVVVEEKVIDYDGTTEVEGVFTDYRKAVDKRNELVEHYRETAERWRYEGCENDWFDDEKLFSIWEDGYYATNHIDIAIYENELI